MSVAATSTGIEQFLALPELQPALEYYGGRIIQKAVPKLDHCILQPDLCAILNDHARPRKLGRAYSELRWTAPGDSFVPDIAFIRRGLIPRDVTGRLEQNIQFPPDLVVEIRSPGQTLAELRRKIKWEIKLGVPLGWLFNPPRRRLFVLTDGQPVVELGPGDFLTAPALLPGFRLDLGEFFGRLDED